MAFCPNLSDPDIALEFSLIEDKVGNDIAHLLWDKYEGVVDFIWGEIDMRTEEVMGNPYLDERLTAAFDKYGDEIDDTNNPYVWDIENGLDLVKWSTPEKGEKAKKKPVLYTYKKAQELAAKAREMGATSAKVKEVQAESKTTRWMVDVTRSINLPGSDNTLYQLTGQHRPINPDLDNTIRDIAARVSKRIDIPHTFINDATQSFKGKIQNGIAVINLAYATQDTPIHEIFGHPIVRWIKENKPEVYSNLEKELDTEKGKATLEEVKAQYPEAESTEEAIVQLLGEVISDRMTETQDNKSILQQVKELLQQALEFIKSLFTSNEINLESLNTNTTFSELIDLLSDETKDIILSDVNLSETFYQKARPTTPEAIKKAIQDIASDFIFDEEAHTYLHKPSNTYFTSVTQHMSTYGYGISEEVAADPSEALIRGKNLGNAIHLTMEGNVKDITQDIQESTGFQLSDKAQKQLKRYLKDVKEDTKSVIAMSEVLVADPETKRTGTIDLVLIDDKGRIRLFDFKTKEKGFQYYTSTHFGASDQTKYRLQLSIYKHMLEKTLGVRVYDMNVVHFRPVVDTDDTIINVKLDTSFDSSGLDSFNKHAPEFKRIYGEKPVRFTQEQLRDHLEVDYESTQYEYQEERQKVEDRAMTDLERLAAKAKDALEKRYQIVQNKYSFTQRKDFEDFMAELQEVDSSTDTLLSIIQYSAKVTNALIDEHNRIVNRGDKYDIKMLNKWKDYLMAYESLEQIQSMMMKDPNLFKDPKVMDILDKTIKNRKFLVGLYKEEGVKLIADWLVPYYDGIRRKQYDKLAREYRTQVRKKRRKGQSLEQITEELGTEEAFIEQLIKERNMDLERDTYEFLLEELTIAGRDVSVMARWFDNMLDTADPVAAAMVNAFVEAEDQRRIDAIKKRTELLKQVRTLEKKLDKGNLQSELDFYSFALEFDENGKPTGYLKSPAKSSLREEERDERRRLYKDFTKEEAEARIIAWRKAHLKLHEEDYNDALNNRLITLMQEEVISQEDYDNIMRNQLVSKLPMDSLVKSEEVSEEAAEATLQWMGENRWKYSEIHEKYVSKDWLTWIKSLGIDPNLKQWEQIEAVEKSDHPEAVFYTYLVNLSKQADSMLPYSHRLGYRLPGVAKRNSERVKEGQKPSTYMKETFRSDIFVRPEDTERGTKELTDEKGNPKYFLPIHYTAKLELQNQSFDLAGIYYRYWDSANNYRLKRGILAEMEMTKYFINERSAKKRNAMGEVIQRAAATVGIGDQDEQKRDDPSLISRTKLAEQFNDWFEMAIYGKQSKETSVVNIWGKEIDLAKLADALGRYTSLNLLSTNVVQGAANVLLGDTMQRIDSFAGEYVTPKSLAQGTSYYMRNLPNMLGDFGAREVTTTASRLIERFDILHTDPIRDTVYSKKSRVGQIMDTGTLYIVQHAGEHWMQSRFLFAMLKEKKAYNKEGELLGSMLDQYYNVEGELKIKDKVDLKQSKWTEKDQQAFKRKVKGVLSRMHGEYSDLGKVAIQRAALGRLAYQFRKFIVPGFKRRWAGERYIQRLDQYVEGNYITTGRFAKSLIQDLSTFNLALMAEDWSALSPHEKANVKRTLGEVAFLTAAIVLASFLTNMDGDDPEDEWWNSFMTYQAYRFQAELLFFINPGDALNILRSPMASMSVIENTGRFFNQLLDAGEVYERGPWKGQLKISRTMVNFVPVYKQYYRARDVDEQIKFFSR